jgi:hypothetical protein
MTQENGAHPIQHIGRTVMVVMMDVDPADEEEFHRWYNQQHIPERLEIPGYVSARRFKLESGDDGMLKYMCLWEMEDSSALQHDMYQAQNADPTALYERVTKTVKARARAVYTQIFPESGAYEDKSGFHPRHQEVSA